jgi:hypothetical protein
VAHRGVLVREHRTGRTLRCQMDRGVTHPAHATA